MLHSFAKHRKKRRKISPKIDPPMLHNFAKQCKKRRENLRKIDQNSFKNRRKADMASFTLMVVPQITAWFISELPACEAMSPALEFSELPTPMLCSDIDICDNAD